MKQQQHLFGQQRPFYIKDHNFLYFSLYITAVWITHQWHLFGFYNVMDLCLYNQGTLEHLRVTNMLMLYGWFCIWSTKKPNIYPSVRCWWGSQWKSDCSQWVQTEREICLSLLSSSQCLRETALDQHSEQKLLPIVLDLGRQKTHNIHYFLSFFLPLFFSPHSVVCAHSYLGRCYCNWPGTGSTNLEHNEGLSTCASKNCTDNSNKYRCEYPNNGDTWLTCSGLSPTWHKQNQHKCCLHGCCLKTICIGLVMKQPFIVKV